MTVALARALLADQHPDLAGLPIVHAEDGWDNVMFRLGGTLALRMPRRRAGGALILTEQRWLPQVAPQLPLPTPVPLRVGAPGRGYPFGWSVVPWLEGEPSDLAPPDADQGEALAGFLAALHRPAPADAPHNPYRGSVALETRAEAFELRCAEAQARHGALSPALRRLWDEGCAAPVDAPKSWFHGDLHGRNVLVKEGRLAGVIDWGDMAAGDPACDLAAVVDAAAGPPGAAPRDGGLPGLGGDLGPRSRLGGADDRDAAADHRQPAHAGHGPADDEVARSGAVRRKWGHTRMFNRRPPAAG